MRKIINIILKTLGCIFLVLVAFLSYIFYSITHDGYTGEFELGKGIIYNDEFYCIYGRNSPIPDIPRDIINYNYDSLYVIAKQNLNGEWPRSSFYNSEHYTRLYTDSYRRFIEDRYGTDSFYKSILKRDYYWIIDKQKLYTYGPMLLEEYEAKCDSLNVKITFDPKKERKLKPKR